MPRSIGLAGLPGCGKDTIGDMLVNHHEYGRHAFAGPVKDMLITGLGVTRGEVDGPDKEIPLARLGVSVRTLLQTLGTEWGRNTIDPNLWVEIAAQRTAYFRQAGIPVVFTDVRFENEAAFVRRIGGAIWHVRRPDNRKVVNMHESNKGIALERGTDSVITNDAGLDQLADQVRLALAGELVVPRDAA